MYNFSEQENFGIGLKDKLAIGGSLAIIAGALGLSIFGLIKDIKAFLKRRDLDRDPQKFKEAILEKYPTAVNMLQQLEGFWKSYVRSGLHAKTQFNLYKDLEKITRMPDKQEQYEAYIDHKVRLDRSGDKYIFALLLDESLVKKNQVTEEEFGLMGHGGASHALTRMKLAPKKLARGIKKNIGAIAFITSLAGVLGLSAAYLIKTIKASLKRRDLDRDPQKFKEAILQKYPTATSMLQQLEGFFKAMMRPSDTKTELALYYDLEQITRMPDKQAKYEAYIEHKVSLKRPSEKLIFALLLDESLVKKNRTEENFSYELNFSERVELLDERIFNFAITDTRRLIGTAPAPKGGAFKKLMLVLGITAAGGAAVAGIYKLLSDRKKMSELNDNVLSKFPTASKLISELKKLKKDETVDGYIAKLTEVSKISDKQEQESAYKSLVNSLIKSGKFAKMLFLTLVNGSKIQNF